MDKELQGLLIFTGCLVLVVVMIMGLDMHYDHLDYKICIEKTKVVTDCKGDK